MEVGTPKPGKRAGCGQVINERLTSGRQSSDPTFEPAPGVAACPKRGKHPISRMDRIITLQEPKAAETERRRRAVDDLRSTLAAYARDHGGRFLLFGSAARGDTRCTSDVDIVVDFPPDTLDRIWNFAERACWDRRLEPDVIARSGCKADFLAHVDPDIEVIQ